jgi:hypothetical protein
MKFCKSILIIISICIVQLLNAQNKNNGDIDNEKSLKFIINYLQLSQKQSQQFNSLEVDEMKMGDSLRSREFNDEKRKVYLNAFLQAHDKSLRNILTDVQWKKYKDFLERSKKEFLKYTSSKNLRVAMIKRSPD